ncbi:uncharacterized protein BO97DRAFT_471274 [Aspergillus homomorphus CBS 101889]|uniref:Fe2OG dioxygenase domain-containing protein n=1 Tax=Aspergillus homomorphus (strain CBS 101889) TaxID=1450537 RepID=A0A395HTU1_ASPHC|nr:hypothetical protein BO97DRAFT_471274 [Aspergillus homomorphus CBS 101889]RAL10966.1 hypothetical protein BO97DRAFT_471274 [Aspergillus homomorphus CBS 101889]
MAAAAVQAPIAIPAPIAPPTVIAPTTLRATRPTKQIPQSLIDKARAVEKVEFDATKHLAAAEPGKVFTMNDLGFEGAGISPTALSEPFPLFTPEAVQQIRAEIFSEPVLRDCQYASSFATNMIRGYGPQRAPFIFNAWNSPELLATISKVAGIDLVPAMDMDVGHVNVSVNDKDAHTVEVKRDESGDDSMPAFAWHHDSYPFVCVTMLSDCEGMVGGETAVKTGNGEVLKFRGPLMGTAVVMQGRYIEHQALKALGGRERISMVTSFRPRNPLVKDETVLASVRGISELPELYSQYALYRLENLEERLRAQLKTLREQHARRQFDITRIRGALAEQRDFLDWTMGELIV